MPIELTVTIAGYLLLLGLAVCASLKQDDFHWQDLLAPFSSLLLWAGLTSIGYGAQSLANLIEIPILVSVMLIAYWLRILFVSTLGMLRMGPYCLFYSGLFLAGALRTLMPLIPE
ncbi:hypothetical protein QWZ04_15905 [Vibrio tapetis subsp. quintayensis]|uniref:hypothetical protein n=1 Tax=Vibrio tapetis TaxID=52443 RepID=UPI0025B508F0|nr:hypothetical protein [Vibrio tapetis]MDN3681789.1 hypothetical protein [Vibrio tapetis subsp. quintayensis]